ncbi:hypothetical protein [Micromonospora sp. WMMD812]|uniref:effector-associated constant component EACC1 n=1 Tax=Micromonospora sp. WMMD812 TaxID=3015152 RepID=UPI00248CD2B5|nr:hypothetical protein [Micromonospora sp. WMMD812]WBB69080.1 hypothetical protein O7603_06940 [Micromonospora sp. WMMD812]
MEVVVKIEGGRADELGSLERAVKTDLRAQGVRTVRTVGQVEQGALGAREVLQFVGESVMLPVLLQSLYDYVTQRLREPRRANLKFHAVRADLPDGTRRTELTLEGEAKDVATALKELQ